MLRAGTHVLLLAVLLLPRVVTGAPVLTVLDITGGSAAPAGGSAVIGWEFTVSSPIAIKGLGFWDEVGDGLIVSHEVGLWNGDGSTLLASATVDGSGETNIGAQDGVWRFTDIPRLSLLPGSYVVAATVGNFDPLRNSLAPLQIMTISEASYVEARFLGSAIFQYPPSSISIDSFGPNLLLDLDAPTVPALPPIGLVALALMLVVGAASAATFVRR